MTKIRHYLSLAAIVIAAPLFAQETVATAATTDSGSAKPAATPAEPTRSMMVQSIEIQRLRPVDQRGVNVFEAPKTDNVAYQGFKLAWGAAFTQQFQGLDHKNSSTKPLVRIGHGFNNANANLYMNAQLAPGIRVALTSYLSARHHQETWVKDGYLLIDESPLKLLPLQFIMAYTTVKAGHFEINYGDAHFRRTDNGHSLYNPFVGNLILDAFTTEIGGEVYLRASGLMLMGGITGGEVRGAVRSPEKRSPAFLGKAGFDRQITPDLRVRLTGSAFTQKHSMNNTLYTGDRAGSRYYSVMDTVGSTETAQAWSGNIQPGFGDKVSARVINPFVKFRGAELFANIETAKGRAGTEVNDRKWTQNSVEGLYRFAADEQLYVGARYNVAKGQLPNVRVGGAGTALADLTIDRYQASAGWFITPGVLLKAEYMTQTYDGFPVADPRSGGKFKGFVVEGVVAF
ncbi:MAG TPA: hypothetical protein VHM67_11505 [Gemmatimonadaceae bacterium]|nr:hypothetical protein [Gemmatimonadaceae bacterium]